MVNVIIKSSFQCASNYSQPQTEWRTDGHGCQLSKLTENTIIWNWSWMIALLYFCKTSAPMTESTESVEACLWRAVPLFWSLSYNASVYGLVFGKGLSQAVYTINIRFFKNVLRTFPFNWIQPINCIYIDWSAVGQKQIPPTSWNELGNKLNVSIKRNPFLISPCRAGMNNILVEWNVFCQPAECSLAGCCPTSSPEAVAGRRLSRDTKCRSEISADRKLLFSWGSWCSCCATMVFELP